MKKEPIDIRAIRLELGFTQEDLARKLGLSLSTVSKWEQGVTSPSRLAREKLEGLLKRGGKKKWVSLHPKAMRLRLMTGRMGWCPFEANSITKPKSVQLRKEDGTTLLAIQEYLKANGNGTNPDHSISNTLGKHGIYEETSLTPKAVDCLIKSVAKKALINKWIHPHVMRHTFATTLLDNGNDLRTVQALMGHTNIRTTET